MTHPARCIDPGDPAPRPSRGFRAGARSIDSLDENPFDLHRRPGRELARRIMGEVDLERLVRE